MPSSTHSYRSEENRFHLTASRSYEFAYQSECGDHRLHDKALALSPLMEAAGADASSMDVFHSCRQTFRQRRSGIILWNLTGLTA